MKMKVDGALNIKFENLQEKYLLYCEEVFFFLSPWKMLMCLTLICIYCIFERAENVTGHTSECYNTGFNS